MFLEKLWNFVLFLRFMPRNMGVEKKRSIKKKRTILQMLISSHVTKTQKKAKKKTISTREGGAPFASITPSSQKFGRANDLL